MMLRTERFMHLQNLKAHYKNMIQTTATYNFKKKDKGEITNQNLVPKKLEKIQDYQPSKNRHTEFNNLHIIFQERQKESKKKTIAIFHSVPLKRKKTIDYQIQSENLKLIKRLKDVTPTVGNRSEWKKHFKIFKQQKKKLSKSHTFQQSKEFVNLSTTIDSLRKKLTSANGGRSQSQNTRRRTLRRPLTSINDMELRNQNIQKINQRKDEDLTLDNNRYDNFAEQQNEREIYTEY